MKFLASELSNHIQPLRREMDEVLKRVVTAEERTVVNEGKLAEITKQLDGVDGTLRNHGSKLTDLESKVTSFERNVRSSSADSSSRGVGSAWGSGAAREPSASRPQGGAQGANAYSGFSAPRDSSDTPATRIEFVGLHGYERRMEQALDAQQAKQFLRSIFDALSTDVKEFLAAWSVIEADIANNRALVFLPAMPFEVGGHRAGP